MATGGVSRIVGANRSFETHRDLFAQRDEIGVRHKAMRKVTKEVLKPAFYEGNANQNTVRTGE